MGIERTARNLAELTRALEVLKRGAVPEKLDINSLLYEVWENLANDGKCDGAQIDWGLDPEIIPEISANRGLLAEAFRLILENALEANDHQHIHLRLCTRYVVNDSEIIVEVEDDGKGIPPQILERLFLQPVVSAKDDPAGMGHGTGLWLVGLVLTRLKGSIQILRTGLGQGTIVQITLPVTS
jgi:signal transduction histidine kinase